MGGGGRSGEAKSWRTDKEISWQKQQQQGSGQRELARWDSGPSSAGAGVDFEKEARLGGGWDQFEVNRKLFGVTTSFDESVYTTQLDSSAPGFREKEAEAARLAREILTKQASNIHLAEERGQVVGADYDEEERYGAVVRDSTSAVTDGGDEFGSVQLPPPRNGRMSGPRKSITALHADAESLEAAKSVVDQATAKVTRRLSQINESDLKAVLSEEG